MNAIKGQEILVMTIKNSYRNTSTVSQSLSWGKSMRDRYRHWHLAQDNCGITKTPKRLLLHEHRTLLVLILRKGRTISPLTIREAVNPEIILGIMDKISQWSNLFKDLYLLPVVRMQQAVRGITCTLRLNWCQDCYLGKTVLILQSIKPYSKSLLIRVSFLQGLARWWAIKFPRYRMTQGQFWLPLW
jgi:hypothetical protein